VVVIKVVSFSWGNWSSDAEGAPIAATYPLHLMVSK
jgi:hypothetical protein